MSLVPLQVRVLVSLIALGCLGGAGAARADERPATIPTRDVDVVYQTARSDAAGHEQVLSQRMRWAASAGKLRVDPPTGGLYMILDYQTHRLLAVRDSARAVVEMNAGSATATPGIGNGGHFERAGSDRIAGLACTDWNTKDSSGMAATVCLTDDGVLLRATSGAHILVQAASVIYGSLSASIFAVPDDYQHVGPPKPEASSP